MNKEPYFLRETPEEPSEWDALAQYAEQQNLSDKMSQELSDESKKQLEDKLAEIDEAEEHDFGNEFKISHKHTREDYNRFRKEATEQALANDLSKLSAEQAASLQGLLAEIDDTERKDYENEYAINHKHTREEYERFRKEAIAEAIKNANGGQTGPEQVTPEQVPEQNPEQPTDQNFTEINENNPNGNKDAMGQAILDGLNSPEGINAILDHENENDINNENNQDIANENDADVEQGEQSGEVSGETQEGEMDPEKRRGRIGDKLRDINDELLKRDKEKLKQIDDKRKQIDEQLEKLSDTGIDISDIADELDKEFDKDKVNRLEELGKLLDERLPQLAELYARNRRLFVGAKNRAEFVKARGEYEKMLNEYIKLRAEMVQSDGMKKIMNQIEERIKSANQVWEAYMDWFTKEESSEYDDPERAIEDRRRKLTEDTVASIKDEYEGLTEKLECEVRAQIAIDLMAERNDLERATIDKLDNGTLCRKIVSKVLNNKFFKGALVAAGVAGLAATGVGLAAGIAAGTASIGFGLTAGGAAMGAARGATASTIMSRQDSKNSAVNKFASDGSIKKQVAEIDVSNLDGDVGNVVSWLSDEYANANQTDLSSNRKRTAVAAGLGAAVGALMSGIQINKVETDTVTKKVQVGTEPTEYKPTYFDDVNIPRGHGAYDTFTQMGGDPKNLDQALRIMHSIDSEYGLVPGSNGVTPGAGGGIGEFAHTYPGPISSWPDVVRSYITEVAQRWAEAGLIPADTTGGGPIYDTVTKTVTKVIPNAFLNFITRASTTAAIGGVAGIASSAPNRRNN